MSTPNPRTIIAGALDRAGSALAGASGRVPGSAFRRPVGLLLAGSLGVALSLGPAFWEVPAAVRARTPGGGAGPTTSATGEPAAQAAKPAPKPRTELVGFYVNWDESSYRSLSANIEHLTTVMPEWYTVGANGKVRSLGDAKRRRTMKLIRSKRPDLAVMPIVNNFGAGQNPKALSGVLAKRGARKRLAADIVRTMRRGGFQGVNIDFEGLTSADRTNLVRFMRELYPLAKRNGLTVSADVLASSATYDYKALAANVDYLVPMMYDEHWKTSPPGPVASQGWYERSLKRFLAQVPSNKVVIAIGSWTYGWSAGSSRAKAYTYPKAMAEARKAKVPVKLERKSLNPTFAVRKGGSKQRFWMLDATTTFNHVKAASKSKPRGYAIWRLGAEDPASWRVLPKRDKLDSGVAESLRTDRRSIQYDKSKGLIVGQRVAP